MTLNGSLAGLVAITAGCSVVAPWAAVVIGICSGILVVLGIEFVDKKLHIDDPVGAVGVHGVNGMFGALACGLFNRDTGLFTTGDPGQLAVQAIGVLAIVAWTAVLMTVCFLVIKKTIGLRVSKAEEIKGLDSTEHGLAMAYADFMPSAIPTVNMTSYKDDIKTVAVVEAPVEEAVPVEMVGTDPSSAKIYKVSIVCNQNRFEALKNALNAIEVTGITVTQVLGCGVQKGASEYYRGVAMDINLLPKVKIDVVVSKVPVDAVVKATRKALYTGNIGDGKIFVYGVENVVKVRTGEEGYDALQG